MILSIRSIILCAGLLCCYACQGQKQPTTEQDVATETLLGKAVTELPTQVWAIYQERSGHYWFGGNGEGVYFYDGHKMIEYTTADGLVDNQIRGIQEDKFGNIYFDTPKGVSRFDGKAFTTLYPVSSPLNQWKLEPDDLWFSMNGNGNAVYRYDGTSLYLLTLPEYDLEEDLGIEFEENPSFSPYGVYSIHKDKEGVMWFGTLMAGVYRYDGTDAMWIKEKELSVLDDGRVPAVRSIIQDKDGYYWLSNSLSRYRFYWVDMSADGPGHWAYEKTKGMTAGPDRMSFAYFMSAVTDDETGDLWMLTYSDGMWRYDGEQLFHYPITHEGKDVLLFTMFKDREGGIWLGSHNAGGFRFNGEAFERFVLP